MQRPTIMKQKLPTSAFFDYDMQLETNVMFFLEQPFAMDIVIRDDESKRAYCIVGESLFYAHIFQDGSIDTNSWQPIDQELTPYHKDMIEKLKNLHNTTRSLHAPIADFPFL